MSDFYIKSGDRLPVIGATLSDANGVIPLTGATVKFVMAEKYSGSPKVNAVATIVDALAGKVSYAWVLADTDTPGRYDAEWEITFGDGKVLTVPNDGFLDVVVLRDLG